MAGCGPEQGDGGEGVGEVLVGHGEGAVLAHPVGVRVGHLVEAQHGDAAAGQTPGEVLERLAPSDAAVAVFRSRAAQQHQRREQAGLTLARQAERAGHGQRPRAERHVALIEPVGIRVAGRFPRRGGLGVAGRRELDPGQLAVPGQVHRERLLAALEGQRDTDRDHRAVGRIAGRGADRGELTALGQLGLPGGLQPGGGDHRPQPRGEQLADLVELPRPGQLDDGHRPVRCARRELFWFGGGHWLSSSVVPLAPPEPGSSGAGSMTVYSIRRRRPSPGPLASRGAVMAARSRR